MSVNLNFEKPSTIARFFNRYNLATGEIEPCPHSAYIRFEGGVPVASALSNIVSIDHTDSHTMVFGSTGSKKTRLIVMPTIKILGIAGESMVINDTKGELYHRLEAELSTLGYQIIVLDLRDPKRGNCWNPLAIPYAMYLQGDIDKATELVNDIATNLMVSKASSGQSLDPYWDYSAADCFFGLSLLLFKFCKEHNVPETEVNISNLLSLRRKLFTGSSFRKEYDEDLWKYAQEDDVIAASLSGTITALERTKASILSIFDQNMRTFVIQPTLLEMLSKTDFEMKSIAEKKTALFLITPDEKSSYHRLVSLFVKQSYEYLINIAMKNLAGKVHIRLNYILDEFGALPPITDMNSMVAAARSRDIRFLLVTQSKHQLIEHYGDSAQTIISNCSNWIFLTSREIDLLQEISQLCGESERKMPNLSVFDLQHFNKDKGEALLLSGRFKPCKVYLPDIDEYYRVPGNKHKVEFIAAREVPLRGSIELKKVDFVLSREVKSRLGLIEDDDNDETEDDFDLDFSLPESEHNEEDKEKGDSNKLLAQLYGDYLISLTNTISDNDTRISEIIAECKDIEKCEDGSIMESACMDVIEKIVSFSEEQSKDDAARLVAKGIIVMDNIHSPEQLVRIYKVVLHEILIATTEEFNLLKHQIFGN